MTRHLSFFVFLLCAVGLACSSIEAHAAEIFKVKGQKVLVVGEAGELQRGKIYYVVNELGERKGIIQILNVRGNKGIARLGKGQAKPGWMIQARDGTNFSSSAASSGPSSRAKILVGGMGGFAMNSMDVSGLGSSENQSTSMSGNGFSLKGFIDYALTKNFWFRGFLGTELFDTSSGDQFCGKGQNQTCQGSISYLSLALWGRYSFLDGQYRPWVGAGLDILYPLSKEVTAVTSDSVSNTTVMAVGAGMDVFIKNKWFIPVSIEYGLFPESNEVSANTIALRAGVGYAWK